MDDNNIMGKRIKECRENLGLTQQELGLKIGVQRAAVNKYENGDVQNMKRIVIKKLSDIFEVSPSWLMGLEDEDPNPKYDIPQQLFQNQDLKVLFSLADDLSEEDIKFLTEMAKRMKGE